MPYPPKDGGSIATFNHIKAFAKLGHQVTVLAMNTSKHYFDTKDLPDEIKELAYFITVRVDNRINPLHAFLNLFTNRSYHVQRFISGEYRRILVSLLKKKTYDIIQLEGLYLSPYVETIREHSRASVVMRSHNVEHEIWERITANKAFSFKNLYLKILSKRLKKYEASKLNKYDLLVPITEKDAHNIKKLGCTKPVFTSQAGIDLELLRPDGVELDFPSLFHIGALDWIPNQEGIKWFLKNIWSKLYISHPNLKFYIAGRGDSSWLEKIKYPNVEILGEIEDAYGFMRSKAIMVVPLFAGSGMRIKIMEGMALGKTIISTTIGAEGIEHVDKENILIANTPSDFITVITKCIENRDMVDKIGRNARKFVENNYDNTKIVKALSVYYQEKL